MFNYKTHGTCSTMIHFDINDDGTVTDVSFDNGCKGNLEAISRLVEGKTPDEVIFLLKGIDCHGGTSCSDQLALAMEKYLAEHSK